MSKAALTVGSHLKWNEESWTVTSLSGDCVIIRSSQGKTAIVAFPELVLASSFRILDIPDVTNSLAVDLDNVPEALLEKARDLEAHVCEAVTGYRSGYSETALPDEPRDQYNPEITTLTQRISAKATELGQVDKTIWSAKKAYETQGLWGLIDQRQMQALYQQRDPRLLEAVNHAIKKRVNGATITKRQMRNQIKNFLEEKYPEAHIKPPCDVVLNRLIDEMSQGRAIFASTKTRQSISNRPDAPYDRLEVSRPGEVIEIDTQSLDCFALDPLTFKWVQVQLTVALDLYSRSIVAWRFTPVSTKGVDAAMLLYDIIRPKPMRPGWPENFRWAYVGVPDVIIIEFAGESAALNGVAAIPFVTPDTVVVDRGKIYLSKAFKYGCMSLQVNLQLCRPRTPTDKPHIERLFRTINERFVEFLPGYKGKDLSSRGKNPEDEAFYFIPELEALFAEWLLTDYQTKVHEGIVIPHVPHLSLTPNEMYQEGIARAGLVYVVPDPSLYYQLLPCEYRMIHHYGIEYDTLRYDGEILNDFRNTMSPYVGENKGLWPIRVDPRDQSEIYFQHPFTKDWHPLMWVDREGPERPFNDTSVAYAKGLVVARGGNVREDTPKELNQYLNRISNPNPKHHRERRLAAKNVIQAALAERDRPTKPRGPGRSVGAISGPDTASDLDIWSGAQTAVTTKDNENGQDNLSESNNGKVLRTVDDVIRDGDFDF